MPEFSTDLRAFSFVLAVPDLERNTAYFRDALGFKLEWPEGSGWQLVSRGTVRVMLGHCPDAIPPVDIGDHRYFGYLHVDDADALYALWQAAAVEGRLTIPRDTAYRMREFAHVDPDGNLYTAEGGNARKSGHLPAAVRACRGAR